MRPAFNFEHKYSVTMLTREEWTEDLGLNLQLRDSSVIQMDSIGWGKGGGRGRVCGQSLGRRFSICVGKYATFFQAELYATLAYEIQTNYRTEEQATICSDSLVALKALHVAKITSPLVQQCQKAVNDISNRHVVGLFRVHRYSGVRRNEIGNRLAREELLTSLLDRNQHWGSLGRL